MVSLQLHFLTPIVNVHWAGGLHFLYSGADGMFGSRDGQTWHQAEGSVAATSLAWVDKVWVGCGPGGVWRSEDGADTWQVVAAPAFEEVVAMKPVGVGEDGKPKKGVFAGWLASETHGLVYISRDLGETWSVALSISTTVGDSGDEAIIGLSGCGGALFVCTRYISERFHAGDGKIYSSTDGTGFSSQTVFGPGTVIEPGNPIQFPRIGYSAYAVGYDAKNKSYIAIGGREVRPEFGVQESYLVYSQSSGTSFPAGAGTMAASATQTTGIGTFLSGTPSAAGGDGRHVTGLYHFNSGPGGAFISGELQSIFIPGAQQTVQSMGTSAGGYIGSFCFKRKGERIGEGSTEDGDEPSGGVFACAVFGSDMSGGAYVATSAGGGFAKTHSGTAINTGGESSTRPRGAVAVGNISFLGEEPDAGL